MLAYIVALFSWKTYLMVSFHYSAFTGTWVRDGVRKEQNFKA
jgi:hypothetical protein